MRPNPSRALSRRLTSSLLAVSSHRMFMCKAVPETSYERASEVAAALAIASAGPEKIFPRFAARWVTRTNAWVRRDVSRVGRASHRFVATTPEGPRRVGAGQDTAGGNHARRASSGGIER